VTCTSFPDFAVLPIGSASAVRCTTMHGMVSPVSFRWPTELVARIDLARGDVPRSAWVRRAVEQALENASRVAPGGVVRESVTPLPAPAEQPLGLPSPPEGMSGLPGSDPAPAVVQAAEMSSSHVPAGMPGTSPVFSPRAVMRRSPRVRPDVKPFPRR
jgi:hypothetical protein